MGYDNESAVLMTQVARKLQQVCAGDSLQSRMLTHPSSNIDVGQTGSFTAPSSPALNGTMELAKDVLNLSEVDQKIMELDQMMAKAQLGSPDEPEARQWQELSVMTLQWSRKNLVEQRQACLRRIIDLASGQIGTSVNPPCNELSAPCHTTSEPACFRPPPGLEELQLEAMVSPPGQWVQNDQMQEREHRVSSMTVSEEDLDFETSLRKDSGVPDLENTGETLRMHLQSLQDEDPKNVLILRKINKLGFESPDLLETYFSEFGDVKRVLVAHSRVKPSNRRSRSRVRPAGLGFVVMASRADIDAVLCLGEQHVVADVPIQVQSYEQRGKQDFTNLLEDEC
eukprot:gnl/MRDRNA2_/MRDRNA2_203777_c0_seq1.p1 gnl/MRDRNA2_/MRDRNA2_203777_c0~~gnl/MRDRNA2_/MRDRNA2_203777_c0_seq1.p1  ORF type:complete len:340 (+),score=73.62 gnl/MRDRNA2_/MRDRNA2_203777_c0_seq1:255-1274(+)